jgi:uncharacterized protein YjiK
MPKHFYIIAFLFIHLFIKCQSPEDVETVLPYEFHQPDAVLKLHNDLREISGLAYWNTDTLVANQDEDGELFFLSARTGELLLKTEFGDDGDYEGIAVRDQTVFVLRSDGDVYRVENPTSEDPDSDKNETHLSDDHDTEGLFYEKDKDLLLIACKAETDEFYGYRTIFSLKPGEKDIDRKPFLLIDEEDLLEKLHVKYGNRLGSRFKPSGLARHPETGDLYILSAANSILAVYDEKQNLKETVRLPYAHTNQMEGICFAPDGTLFISSEGGTGKIAVFKKQMNE